MKAPFDRSACECRDPGCAVHRGDGHCPHEHGPTWIYKPPDVALCDACAAAAGVAPPPVAGGQGRDADDVTGDGRVLLTITFLLALLALYLIGTL